MKKFWTKTYHLIINDKQDITIYELNKTLKELSIKNRQRIYLNNEFQESIKNKQPYIFISCNKNDKEWLENISNTLRKSGVSAFIVNDKEYNVLMEEYNSEE